MNQNFKGLKLILLPLILGGVVLLFNACRKKCFKGYEFIIPFTVYPAIDTFNVGDTLWVKADFSDQILDHFSGERYDASNFNLKTYFRLNELINDTIYLVEQPGAFFDLDVVSKIGEINPYTDKSASLEYAQNNGKYQIKFGLVPKKKGVFNFRFYYNVSRRNTEVDFTDTRCEQTMNHMRFLVNVPDNNYYLRDEHSDLSWARDDRQIHTMEKGCYTFIVE